MTSSRAILKNVIFLVMIVNFTTYQCAEYHTCGTSKSGHAIEQPREVDCKPPVKNEDKPFRVNITVYVPRTKPVLAMAYKCWIREREICTYNSFSVRKALLAILLL